MKKGQSPPRASEIFKPIILDAVYAEDGTLATHKFYLVDVETFKNPLVVIPNIGKNYEFLMMTPRDKWSEDFKSWIHAVHTFDKEEMEE
jgi:hypothetical protein